MITLDMLDAEVDLDKEYERISSILMALGLTSYESKAYIALVAHGYASAEAISQTASIPRTSAYKVLQSLCDKGYAIAAKGRPQIFKPELPSKVKERELSRISEAFQKLELLHEIFRDKGEPQLVYTISGKARVLSKIGELMDKATKTFIISTPNISEIRENLKKNIEMAVARGIEVTIITSPGQRIPKGVRAVRKQGLIATDVISDAKQALIASPDLSACGYTDNEYLARHLENFLAILMER